MHTNRKPRISPPKLLALMLLALIPPLALNGGQAAVTQAALPTTQQPTPQQGYTTLMLRVYFSDLAERDRLATELAAEEAPTTGGYLSVIGDQARIAELRARGLRVEIDQAQTVAINTPVLFGHNADTFYGGYYTVEEVQGFMDQKVASYPSLVEKVDIGDSWCKTHPGACTVPNTWAGYDLFAMHITNRNIPGPKPVFWYNGGLHSREIATTEVAIRYISYLLDNYDTNADARWLVDHHDIWVMPMVNPDGRHMVENGNNTPRSQRKNADRDDGCTNWPPPGIGTDLNRNFPSLWNCCGGSSGNACSDTYRGPSSGSEEETQAVVNKIRELIPDQRGPNPTDPAPLTATGNYVDMHASGNYNLYLWGWTSAQTPNHVDLRNIAAHMSVPNAGGNNYTYCQSGPCFYVTDGASDDWAYGELGPPAYTVEIGTSFFPQYTCVENPCGGSPGLWPENKGMLLYMAKIARTPYLTNRGPDANTVATSPMTVTQGVASQLNATINYNWTDNAYLQNVSVAEYYIDTPPWSGGTPVAMTPTDGSFNSSTEGAQATIDTSSIPVGRHIIFVRGRGVNDYGGFGSWGPISAAWLTVTSTGGSPTPTTLPVGTGTATVIIPTATRTSTPNPPTWTVIPEATTVTPQSPTSTRTATTGQPTSTATRISTAYPPTWTVIPEATTAIPPSNTPVQPTSTSTACAITFSDVDETNTFYANIRCLACRGIISGYSDGTFRPNNEISRGQIAKMVSNSAGFGEDPGSQIYEDVPPASPFYDWINRLSMRGHMGGYNCGIIPEEPCGLENRPYFRPSASATRGQLAKIVSNAAGLTGTSTELFYTDVQLDNPFYVWIMRLTNLQVMSGYQCGGPNEPCDESNRPYFRPYATVTRGQASKIVANTFFPNCQTP